MYVTVRCTQWDKLPFFKKMTENLSKYAHCAAKSVCVCFCVNHVGFFWVFFNYVKTTRYFKHHDLLFLFTFFHFFFRIIQRLGFFLEISVILYSLIPSFIIMNNRTIIIIIINQFFGSRRARSYGVAF